MACWCDRASKYCVKVVVVLRLRIKILLLLLRYFRIKSFEFTLGSFGSHHKISNVRNIKRLLLSHFSSTFNQTLQKVYSGKILGYYFCCYVPNFKSITLWSIDYLAYIATIHNAILVSCYKGQSDRQGPWASCYVIIIRHLDLGSDVATGGSDVAARDSRRKH